MSRRAVRPEPQASVILSGAKLRMTCTAVFLSLAAFSELAQAQVPAPKPAPTRPRPTKPAPPKPSAAAPAQPAPKPIAQSQRCTFQIDNVDRQGAVNETPSGTNYFAGGNVRLRCRNMQIAMQSDSVAAYG